MIVKKHISKTLKDLDDRYNIAMSSSSLESSVYYSKLAVLEYCGWIEESFDKIVRRTVKDKLKTAEYRNLLENNIIKRTYGFRYVENFRPMLISSIGLVAMENLESQLVRKGFLDVLKSELCTVKLERDSAAHTWINNTTRTYSAPSVTKARLEKIYPIAREIYSLVVRL